MLNRVVMQLTSRTVLGGKRKLLLFALPGVIVALAVAVRALAGADGAESIAPGMLGGFALGTLLPLMSLIAGTGSIGPEIDDGSIMYLLAKPVKRSSIVVSKLLVAIAVTLVFGALPVAVAGVVLTGELGDVTIAFTFASVVAAIAYCTVFLLLAIVSRNAVVFGLMYAVVWETLVGQYVPGAQSLSIQQWSLAATEQAFEAQARAAEIDAAVGGIGVVLLVALVAGGTWFATQKLRSLRINSDEG